MQRLRSFAFVQGASRRFCRRWWWGLAGIVGGLLASSAPAAPVARIPILVPYHPLLDFSRANWEALTIVSNQMGDSFPFAPTRIEYQDERRLAAALEQELAQAGEGEVVVFGPADSGEAAYLDQVLTNLSSKVVFVSSTVTSKVRYVHLQRFVRACLPDDLRIGSLTAVAPRTWKYLDAAFVGNTNSWGEQLYRHLSQSTNLAKTLTRHKVVSTGREAQTEYENIADACRSARTQLLFLGLDSAAEVRAFLEQCQNQSRFWAPYKPMICLVGDYRFTNTADTAVAPAELIPSEWGNRLPITMLSEATLGVEGVELYRNLAQDLVRAFCHLRAGRSNPEFLQALETAFNQDTASHRLWSDLPVSASYYLRYLQNPSQTPCVLKWLGYERIPLVSDRNWVRISRDGPALFWLDLLRTRVFWIGNPYLILIALASLTGGFLLEIQKRYVFVQRRAISLVSRVLAWILIISSLFIVLLYLSWVDTLNPVNFTAIVVTCITPMAIFAVVQHAAAMKLPFLQPALDFIPQRVEWLMDRCINSQVSGLRELHARAIRLDLERKTDGTAVHREAALWRWWHEELRKIRGEARARKVYERFIPAIRAWNKDFEEDSRLEELVDAVAYTRIINRVPVPAPPPGGAVPEASQPAPLDAPSPV